MKKVSKGVQFLLDCRNPFFYINSMWGLIPQPPKPEYEEILKTLDPRKWTAEMFGDCERIEHDNGRYYMSWTWHEFKKGKHITWQQCAILTAIKNHTENLNDSIALEQFLGLITVASGHGV